MTCRSTILLVALLASACAPRGVSPEASASATANTTRPDRQAARSLYKAALSAQDDGDLDVALDLARESYIAHPTWKGLDYVRILEAEVTDLGELADATQKHGTD